MKANIGKTILHIILLLFSTVCSYCQISNAQLESLRKKYPWRSIYITNQSYVTLKSIISDPNRVRNFEQKYGISVIPRLKSFILRYSQLDITESVAFIEINLNLLQAGFKIANDLGGEINTIAWDSAEVVNIAFLFDNEINATAQAVGVIKYIQNPFVSIDSAFFKLQQIKNNEYVASEAYYLASKSFRLCLSVNEKKYVHLKTENPKVYAAIEDFKATFDDRSIKLEVNFDTWKMTGNLKDSSQLGFFQNLNSIEANLVRPQQFIFENDPIPKSDLE